MSRTQAHLGGNLARGEGAQARTIGFFALTLTKEGSSRWQIASEFTAYPGPPLEEDPKRVLEKDDGRLAPDPRRV